MWMSVTEFEAATIDGFEKEWLCFFAIALLFVEYC